MVASRRFRSFAGGALPLVALVLTQVVPSSPAIADYPPIEVNSSFENIPVCVSDTTQSETTIACNPTTPGTLVIGFNALVNSHRLGAFWSYNQGLDWEGSNDCPRHDPPQKGVDPAVAFDGTGRASYSYNRSEKNIELARGGIGPCQWQSSVTVSSWSGFLDRSTILHSWTADSLNVAHAVFSKLAGYWDVHYSRSADTGLTFASSVNLSTGIGHSASRDWGAAVVEGLPGSGDLHVLFPVQDLECGLGVSRIVCKTSRTWGQAFDQDYTVVTDSSFRGIGISTYGRIKENSPNGSFYIWTWPVVAVDTSQSQYRGRVYVAWCDLRNDTDEDNCNPPWANSDIYLTWSSDRCSTFATPVRVNTDAGLTDQYCPALTVDPSGNVHVAFFDSSIDPTGNLYAVIRLATSDNGGQSFAQQVIVSEYGVVPIPSSQGYIGDYIGVTSDSEFVYPCWNDNRRGEYPTSMRGWQQAYVARVPIDREATVPQISGEVTTATWTGMIDILGDVTVSAGDTLTIGPRARITVKSHSDAEEAGIDEGRCELIVYGTLVFEPDTLETARRPVIRSDSSQSDAWIGIRIMEGGVMHSGHGFRLYDAVDGITVEEGAAAAVIRGVRGRNVQHAGIWCKESDVRLVEDTVVDSPDAYGILVDSCDSQVDSCYVSACSVGLYANGSLGRILNCQADDVIDGIMVEDVAGAPEIRGVKVTDVQHSGIWCKGSDVRLVEDTIADSPEAYGMYLDHCDPEVDSCFIDQCATGVNAYVSSGTVQNTRIVGSGEAGVEVNQSDGELYFGEDTLNLSSDIVEGYYSGAHLVADAGGHCRVEDCAFLSGDSAGIGNSSPYGIWADQDAWVRVRRSRIIGWDAEEGAGVYSYWSTANLGTAIDTGWNVIHPIEPNGAGLRVENFVREQDFGDFGGIPPLDFMKAERNWWGDDTPDSSWFLNADFVPYLTSRPGGAKVSAGAAPMVAETDASDFTLRQNYPNPFNSSTTIAFHLGEARHVTVEIFNILGQRIRVLTDRDVAAGNHVLVWDGRDVSGRAVASGIYLYRIRTEGAQEVRKLLLLK